MRSLRIRALPLILVLTFLGLTPITASATTESDVEQAEQARQEAYDRLVAVNEQLDAALLDYHLINGELEELEYRIGVIVERIDDHETSVAELTERARELVTEAYMSAGTGVFQVAFEADNIQDLLTSQVLIDRATDADLIELDRLDVVKREMDRLRDELREDQARVEELSEAAADVVERLDELQRAAAAEYAKEDEAARAARAAYAEEQRRKELEEAARRRGAAGGVGVINGFVCPAPGSRFINDWGFPRSGGRTHKGTDMFAPRGSPVLAVGDGVVTFKSNSLGGIVAYLRTASASYYYAHLDGYAGGVSSGQRVSAGTTIGYVGNTGNALGTSPHLHFQIHPGFGAPVNPYPTVRAAC
jgi:murein DD-endopeptidase MepM/ murein hydrolase activator NlpD